MEYISSLSSLFSFSRLLLLLLKVVNESSNSPKSMEEIMSMTMVLMTGFGDDVC
jgi:hypothetical protein